jgi:Glu-tRNA(Gln) amidotransferase subunit E-like FAD-binding protein
MTDDYSVHNIYVIGNQYIVAAEANIGQNIQQKLKKDDLDAIIDFIKQVSISENNVKEILKALEESDLGSERSKFIPKATEQVWKIIKKILEDTCKVAIPIALALIIEALF